MTWSEAGEKRSSYYSEITTRLREQDRTAQADDKDVRELKNVAKDYDLTPKRFRTSTRHCGASDRIPPPARWRYSKRWRVGNRWPCAASRDPVGSCHGLPGLRRFRQLLDRLVLGVLITNAATAAGNPRRHQPPGRPEFAHQLLLPQPGARTTGRAARRAAAGAAQESVPADHRLGSRRMRDQAVPCLGRQPRRARKNIIVSFEKGFHGAPWLAAGGGIPALKNDRQSRPGLVQVPSRRLRTKDTSFDLFESSLRNRHRPRQRGRRAHGDLQGARPPSRRRPMPNACASGANATARCWCSTKCRPDSVAPARCGLEHYGVVPIWPRSQGHFQSLPLSAVAGRPE